MWAAPVRAAGNESRRVSRAIATGGRPVFGRADAVDQAAAIEAVRRSAELAAPVDLPTAAPAAH